MFPFLTTFLGALAATFFLYASNGIALLLAIVFSLLVIYNVFSMYLTSPLHVSLYLGMIVSWIVAANFFGVLTICIALVCSLLYYMHWNMMQSKELMSGGDGIFALYD